MSLHFQRRQRLPALVPPGSLLVGPRKETSLMVNSPFSFIFTFLTFPSLEDESAVVNDSSSKVVAPPPVTQLRPQLRHHLLLLKCLPSVPLPFAWKGFNMSWSTVLADL